MKTIEQRLKAVNIEEILGELKTKGFAVVPWRRILGLQWVITG
jgi:hypothetical protein